MKLAVGLTNVYELVHSAARKLQTVYTFD